LACSQPGISAKAKLFTLISPALGKASDEVRSLTPSISGDSTLSFGGRWSAVCHPVAIVSTGNSKEKDWVEKSDIVG
jgi:hypothetical protein